MPLKRKLAMIARAMVHLPPGGDSEGLEGEFRAAAEILFGDRLGLGALAGRREEDFMGVVLNLGFNLRRRRRAAGLPLPLFAASDLPHVALDVAELLSELAYAEPLFGGIL